MGDLCFSLHRSFEHQVPCRPLEIPLGHVLNSEDRGLKALLLLLNCLEVHSASQPWFNLFCFVRLGVLINFLCRLTFLLVTSFFLIAIEPCKCQDACPNHDRLQHKNTLEFLSTTNSYFRKKSNSYNYICPCHCAAPPSPPPPSSSPVAPPLQYIMNFYCTNIPVSFVPHLETVF